MHQERILAGIAIAGGNALTWAQSINTGDWSSAGVAAAITGVGFAVVGLVTYAYRQIGAVRLEQKKAWEEANKDSLAVQLDGLRDSLQHARDSLHSLRNESASREMRHAEDVERLTELTRLQQDTIRDLRGEIERLIKQVNDLRGSVNAAVSASEARHDDAPQQRP